MRAAHRGCLHVGPDNGNMMDIVDILRPSADAGNATYQAALRKLLAQADTAGDRQRNPKDATPNPALFAYLTDNAYRDMATLDQLTVGSLAPNLRPEHILVVPNASGVVHIPSLGYT